MERTIVYRAVPEDEGRRLGPWLRDQGIPEHLLAQLKRTPDGLKRACACRTENFTNLKDVREEDESIAASDAECRWIPARSDDVLHVGDQVRIFWQEIPDHPIEPAPVKFNIIYEDEDILVVDKPAGVPVHPAVGNHGNTLANGVSYYAASKGESWVFRCINRLDRSTGGLVLLAKNCLAAAGLSRQMADREIRRTYEAIVAGTAPADGRIDAPIARKPGSIIEREVNFDTGDPAVTHFRTIRSGEIPGIGTCSLLELHLDTGRTHQIRVHMSWLGHPLVGDGLYGSGANEAASLRLHSCRLDFRHPVTGESMTFESPSGFDAQFAANIQ